VSSGRTKRADSRPRTNLIVCPLASSGKTIDVINPTNGKKITEIQEGTAAGRCRPVLHFVLRYPLTPTLYNSPRR
jgi:hypothetical protein